MNITRRFALSLVLAAGTLVASGSVLHAQAQPVAASANLSTQAIAADIWQKARDGDLDALLALVDSLPADRPELAEVVADFKTLKANIAKRETAREAQIAKVTAKLDEQIAKEPTPLNLSRALKEAIELHMLSREADKAAVLTTPRVAELIKTADKAAHEAEAKGDWVFASELFARLNMLLEDQGTYREDAERLVDRLGMIRLYTPKLFWEMRNARQKMEEKGKPLPAFNAQGEDFAAKLKGITQTALIKALSMAGEGHVERVGTKKILIGGMQRVRTMITTHDLNQAFPGLADKEASAQMLGYIDEQIAALSKRAGEVTRDQVPVVVADLLASNRSTIKLPDEAVIHEFGNGAFGELDEFSQIIWPDELQRFKRMTEGSFTGVGIQIQLDEESQMIKVVQPLEGTPAQKAGVRAGDLLKKINDTSAVGLSLDQAIEQITGKRGTLVRLTVDRAGKDVEFELERDTIPIRTAKGWKRTGDSDTDWDYMVDKNAGIGYVRLSGFNDNTTEELHTAIRSMQQSPAGLNGIVLDLRFNPGGLLTQAVSVANTFISDNELVVYTEGAGGAAGEKHYGERGGQVVRNSTPIVVLINDGSASASEIVSGAVEHYGKRGDINAVVIGHRSFGKGSVQNVIPLSSTTYMKLTKQYYHLPDKRVIHRKPGAKDWGVTPDLTVEMLPKQITDALTLRIDADTPPEGRINRKVEDGEQALGDPDPDRLIAEGFDLQLETAVAILKAQAVARQTQKTAQGQNPPRKGG
ncbi:MAG TPA: S41 family peptidase [Phycisphaerales bacterium]|nr:S41 family peptidase [Phycisphaerales bacterium]